MTQKVFVFNFICSYVPLFLTAFIYIPFGNVIVPRLDVLGLLGQETLDEKVSGTSVSPFEVNPDRLRKQVFYFTVTAQAVSLAMETIVPVLKRKAFAKAKDLKNRHQGIEEEYINDFPGEKKFLDRVRGEAELSTYDVTDDLREMCMQVGVISYTNCRALSISSLVTYACSLRFGH
jgi:anoctamin-10